VEILSSYDFVIEHLEGKKNPGDGPSRRSDYAIGYDNMRATLLATLVAMTISESYDDLLPEIMAAQETNVSAIELRPTLVDISTVDDSHWRLVLVTGPAIPSAVLFCSVPDQAKNRSCFYLGGLLPGPDSEPGVFGRVGTGSGFLLYGSFTFGSN
jgi:hypothetical protein